MHAIVSIHDVSPDTLPQVQQLIDGIPQLCRQQLVLLIIPGGDWKPGHIAQLRRWQQQGFELAGHGWHHRCDKIHGLYHRLHALMISRNAAEHLALDVQQIVELLEKNYLWFEEQGLLSPQLYVPPAWALGRISRDSLLQSPFSYFETTSGFYSSKNNKHIRLPLIGFEADTIPRKITLTCWNQLNALFATTQRPVRIGIHPNDGQLLLRQQLHHVLAKVTKIQSYKALFPDHQTTLIKQT